MCGITGVFAENGNALIHKDNLNEAVSRLKKRGPDYQSVYIESHALLGHARLSIIDTSNAANQPFEDVSKRFVIVFIHFSPFIIKVPRHVFFTSTCWQVTFLKPVFSKINFQALIDNVVISKLNSFPQFKES